MRQKFRPTVLEGTLSEFSGLLLELLDGTLVNTTALVDQVASGGRLAGIDVTDDWKPKTTTMVSDFELFVDQEGWAYRRC